MSEPEVLFFDLGGVTLTNGWDMGSRKRATATFGLDDGFEARHKLLAHDLDCGRITLDDYLDRVVFDRPRPFDRDAFIAFMRSQSQPFTGVLEILGELAAGGRYLMAALNNESTELNHYRIDRFLLHRYFDVFFSSCYLGLAKPDPAIYQRALDVVQRPADACVFVDDRPENVAPARALGLRTIVHPGADGLRAALRQVGVTI